MTRITTLSLILLASTMMPAQNTMLGFQATIAKPSGDVGDSNWIDGKLGAGFGFHALIPLRGGGALVPRIDYTMYKNDWTNDFQIREEEKVNILSAGMDFHYYFSGEANQGFFVLAGLGYASGKFDSSYSVNGLDTSVSSTKGAIYLQGGLGLQFNPMIGMEFSYQSLTFSDVETTYLGFTSSQDVSSPSLRASFVMHF